MKLKDKVAMVTGAAQGIGRGVALEYAKNGAKLAIMDINGLKLSDTAKEIESLGVSCIQMTGDVSDTEAVQLFVKTTVEQLGSIDVLTHAAGILRSCAVVDQDESDWDTVIAVNLRSTFLFGKYVGRQMKAQGSGAGRVRRTGQQHRPRHHQHRYDSALSSRPGASLWADL